MKLYVMRHGTAEDQSESGVDADRALTPAGRSRVWSVGKALVDAGEEPLVILTSPLVRAVQTAEIVALATGAADTELPVSVRRDVAPGGDGVRLVRQLVAEGAKRAMVVGHEPDLSGLVSTLLGGFGQPFDKAMVVGVHVGAHSSHARLRFVLHPKSLKLDPDHRNAS